MGTAFFFECQQATFHSGNTPPANLGSPLLRSWYLIQPQNQGLGCEGTFPVYLSPNMVASLWGEELGSALGNTAFWSPSSSFYFYSFHFLSHQKSPRGGAFSSPSLPSLSFLPWQLFWACPHLLATATFSVFTSWGLFPPKYGQAISYQMQRSAFKHTAHTCKPGWLLLVLFPSTDIG